MAKNKEIKLDESELDIYVPSFQGLYNFKETTPIATHIGAYLFVIIMCFKDPSGGTKVSLSDEYLAEISGCKTEEVGKYLDELIKAKVIRMEYSDGRRYIGVNRAAFGNNVDKLIENVNDWITDLNNRKSNPELS